MANASNFNLSQFYNILRKDSLLYAYQFTARLHSDDGDLYGLANNDSTPYHFQSADIPGVTLTNYKTSYLGTEFRTPGVKQFNHTWNAQMLLTQDFKIYDSFKAWQHHISSLEIDGGGIRKVENVTVYLDLLDSTLTQVVRRFVLAGCWMKKVADITLKYEQGGGGPITIPFELRYQYCYYGDEDEPVDPLKA